MSQQLLTGHNMQLLGLGDSENFTITIVTLKISQYPDILECLLSEDIAIVFEQVYP